MIKLEITSDRDNVIPVIRDAIEATMQRMEIGVYKTEQEIQKFEIKYNISSDKFFATSTADDLIGGDEDYISWMGELKLREALIEELQKLNKIEYIFHKLSL